jgi:hypothetical protein
LKGHGREAMYFGSNHKWWFNGVCWKAQKQITHYTKLITPPEEE